MPSQPPVKQRGWPPELLLRGSCPELLLKQCPLRCRCRDSGGHTSTRLGLRVGPPLLRPATAQGGALSRGAVGSGPAREGARGAAELLPPVPRLRVVCARAPLPQTVHHGPACVVRARGALPASAPSRGSPSAPKAFRRRLWKYLSRRSRTPCPAPSSMASWQRSCAWPWAARIRSPPAAGRRRRGIRARTPHHLPAWSWTRKRARSSTRGPSCAPGRTLWPRSPTSSGLRPRGPAVRHALHPRAPALGGHHRRGA